MYGPPLHFAPNNGPWNYRPPQNSQWTPNLRARAPFGDRPRFNQFRPPLQQGNDNFWCETCDRGFPTEDILNKHKQQHQKCNIDGCQFVAHPKVITKHIQMQHSSGLYKKIANINKPEEIEKWREERRKRYPTKANVEKKAAILQEKITRGEKMGLDRKHFKKDHSQNRGVKRKCGNPNEKQSRTSYIDRTNDKPAKRSRKINPPKSLIVVDDNRKLKPFGGISNLFMDCDDEVEEPTEFSDVIEDDVCEEIINEKLIETKSEPMVCGALSSLMCDYGSSDEEELNENIQLESKRMKGSISTNGLKVTKEAPTVNNDNQELKSCTNIENEKFTDINPLLGESKTIQNNKFVLENGAINEREDKKQLKSNHVSQENDDDSGPEEVKVIKNGVLDNICPTESSPNGVKKKTFIEKKRTFHQPQPRLPSTLLHKLLFREMQQERNIVLQCIRYVRNNNYFDKRD